MVEPGDKVVPPEGQPASNSEETAASARQAADRSWTEILNAVRSAEKAVSDAVQGIAKIDSK